MSLCIIKATKDEILMGADSRGSFYIDGKVYKDHDDCEKIYFVHNKAIFSAGISELIDDIISAYKNQSNPDINILFSISKEKSKQFKVKNPELVAQLDDIFLTLIITEYNETIQRPVMHAITNNNSTMQSLAINNNNTAFEAFGIKTFDARNKISVLRQKGLNNDKEIYKQVYDSLSFEGIGGTLKVYSISKDGIKLFFESPIKDKNEIKKIENTVNIFRHSIVGDKLVITNDGWNTFSILLSGDGLTLTSTDKTARVYATLEDGFKIDLGDGAGTWTPAFYVDVVDGVAKLYLAGNAVFTGTIDVSTDVNIGNNIYVGNQNTFIDKGVFFINDTSNTAKLVMRNNGDLVMECNHELKLTTTASSYGININAPNSWIYITGKQGFEIVSTATSAASTIGTSGSGNLYIQHVGSGGIVFDGKIGFFDVTPTTQQTASLMPTDGNSTIHDIEVKINGMLTKLGYYGLFDIS